MPPNNFVPHKVCRELYTSRYPRVKGNQGKLDTRRIPLGFSSDTLWLHRLRYFTRLHA